MVTILVSVLVPLGNSGLFLRRKILSVAASLVGLALCSCHPTQQQTPPAPPPPQVTVGHPLTREIVDYDEFTARLSAVNSVEIRARVNGYLQKVNFKDGAMVKKGDLLFVIDPRPYQAELDRVQAELDRARTQHDLAENDFKRATELFQTKAISAEELDTRSKNRAAADSAVKSAQANLETAQLNMAYTNILAPIDGRLSRALVTEGNLVTGNAKDATLLTTLVSVDPVYAYADIDEATVLKYQELDREGLRKNNNGFIPAELALGNSNTFSYKGVIDFVDNQIDSATGTLHARAVFSNPDGNLIPGQFARLRITGSGKYTGLLIPDYAIGTDQEKKIVYVVKSDKTIQTKQIVPGKIVDGLRVIRSGLDVSDLVVLDRLQILQPGMPVTPKEEPIKPPNQTASDPSPDQAHS
jgi:RND family efflux transporter MFP subunit